MLKWLLHPSKGPTSQVYQSHPCSTNFDAPGYRLVQTCSKTTLSLEVETNAWTCCLVSQGHYVFHDFRYQFIFRDVEDTGREESLVSIDQASMLLMLYDVIMISLLEWTDMDGQWHDWTWFDKSFAAQSPWESFRIFHQSWRNRQHLPLTSLELSLARAGRLIDS